VRICSGAGCLRAVPDDVRFCDECKPQPILSTDDIRVHTLTDREKYAFLYSSPRWTKLRALVIRSQPMCARCRCALSVIVDHVVPAGIAVVQAQDSGRFMYKLAGFFLRSNLQGLCRACHYTKTLEDKTHTGPWDDVVEREQRQAKRVWSFG
jgi:5-methylcytosine-specific restriction endonuclease McrA